MVKVVIAMLSLISTGVFTQEETTHKCNSALQPFPKQIGLLHHRSIVICPTNVKPADSNRQSNPLCAFYGLHPGNSHFTLETTRNDVTCRRVDIPASEVLNNIKKFERPYSVFTNNCQQAANDITHPEGHFHYTKASFSFSPLERPAFQFSLPLFHQALTNKRPHVPNLTQEEREQVENELRKVSEWQFKSLNNVLSGTWKRFRNENYQYLEIYLGIEAIHYLDEISNLL